MGEAVTADEVLAAIRAVRQQAADERAARHARGEPLTDYGSGVLDGLDRAWLAGNRVMRATVQEDVLDPDDMREGADFTSEL